MRYDSTATRSDSIFDNGYIYVQIHIYIHAN